MEEGKESKEAVTRLVIPVSEPKRTKPPMGSSVPTGEYKLCSNTACANTSKETITCRACNHIQYCSDTCRSIHWVESHQRECKSGYCMQCSRSIDRIYGCDTCKMIYTCSTECQTALLKYHRLFCDKYSYVNAFRF
jgi:hypothetical protein